MNAWRRQLEEIIFRKRDVGMRRQVQADGGCAK